MISTGVNPGISLSSHSETVFDLQFEDVYACLLNPLPETPFKVDGPCLRRVPVGTSCGSRIGLVDVSHRTHIS